MDPFLAPQNWVLGAFLSAGTGQFLDTKLGSFGYRFWIHVGPQSLVLGSFLGAKIRQLWAASWVHFKDLGPFLDQQSVPSFSILGFRNSDYGAFLVAKLQ
jgi:hypothetical protein